jgi:cell fate (sporulation/competence/biofilm development) regulator YlbF (YheA/YmcA/DUF963 family)
VYSLGESFASALEIKQNMSMDERLREDKTLIRAKLNNTIHEMSSGDEED